MRWTCGASASSTPCLATGFIAVAIVDICMHIVPCKVVFNQIHWSGSTARLLQKQGKVAVMAAAAKDSYAPFVYNPRVSTGVIGLSLRDKYVFYLK